MDSHLDVYTISQAARILGLEARSVREYVTNGTLPSCGKNAKGRCLITQGVLERYHAQRMRNKKFDLSAAEVQS